MVGKRLCFDKVRFSSSNSISLCAPYTVCLYATRSNSVCASFIISMPVCLRKARIIRVLTNFHKFSLTVDFFGAFSVEHARNVQHCVAMLCNALHGTMFSTMKIIHCPIFQENRRLINDINIMFESFSCKYFQGAFDELSLISTRLVCKLFNSLFLTVQRMLQSFLNEHLNNVCWEQI